MTAKTQKIMTVASKVVTWILIAFTVFMMLFTIITVSTVDKNHRSIFGTKFYIVQTDSMSLSDKNGHLDVHFNAGDIILAKKVKDAKALKSGDIISFLSTNPESYGETITHMIRRVEYDESGKMLGYVTFGTNTDTDDEAIVEPEYILGVYGGKLPGVGNFFAFVKSTPGYIICILIPFLLLIIYNGVNVIRLFRQYKGEQTAIMDAERAAIAEERKRNEEMMLQLQALQAQLMNQGVVKTPEASADATASAEADTETDTEADS